MSKANVRRVLAACAIASIASRSVRAQSTTEYAKRLDSLTATWRAAVIAETRADSERVNGLPVDTVRVGNLVVLSDTEYVELAKNTAALVSPALDRAFGSWASRMRTHVLLLRRRSGASMAEGHPPVESGVVGPGGRVLLSSTSIATADALKSMWLRIAEEFLSGDLDPEIRNWLMVTLTSEPATARTLAQGRVDLVLARSRAAHSCALGDHEACMQALGLVRVDDVPFALFDETQRRGMIEWNAFVLQRRDPAAYTRCVQGGNQATCDSLIRSIPANAVPQAVPAAVRQNLIRYALLVGGDGALDRLANTKGPIADRIAAAARMPIDSVVSRWHSNIMSSQNSSTAIDATTALSSLFWACLCGALALRSSRWR